MFVTLICCIVFIKSLSVHFAYPVDITIGIIFVLIYYIWSLFGEY